MKKLVKKLINKAGWNLNRLTPSSNPTFQLLSTLRHINANLVFDVGANIGQFAQELRNVGYTGEIVSFEPLKTAHRVLSSASESDERWLVHPKAAVGDHDGEVEINVAGNSVSSSILPILDAHTSAAVGSAYVGTELTPILRLDSVAHQYLKPDSRCFIKIDAQGFEWQVLDGAAEIMRKMQGVLVELSLVPLYDGQRLWRDVIGRLTSDGFILWAIQRGFTDPRNGRSLQVDAIFVRDEDLISKG
jgi:FkbM family methyltransferase